ncbi:hypothetical protein VCPCS023_001462B, partial [Vibrio cholerae O1 str. PCS-023]
RGDSFRGRGGGQFNLANLSF